LQLGSLNPISEVSGLKARLANLGYYRGPIDENLDPDTQRAISAFQAKQGLPVTGVADNATQAQLQKNHGH
jgi:peptidoglycan hydrolase-like protein with peptidoglycan-binding domain